MNESVFGQYSVFCVFGSVVGCVVVPFIAKVLQQQVRKFSVTNFYLGFDQISMMELFYGNG